MIVTVSMNPAVDMTLTVEQLAVDGVNRVVETRLDPGGKGINVAKMVKSLGGETLATGIIGGKNGEYICEQLDALGIPHDFVIGTGSTRTNYKISDRTLRTMTELNESGAPVSEEILEQVWQKIDGATKAGDCVVIAGTNPPNMPADTIAKWIERLNAKGVITGLDTIGEPMRLGIAARPTVIKPNQQELSDLFGEQLHYMRDVIAAAHRLVLQGVEHVIVSMGAEGALFVSKNEMLRGYGLKVPVASTVGAGDTTMATVLYDLQQGKNWEEIARHSIAVSAAKVMCSGSQTPTREQYEELLDQVVVERL